MHQGLRLWSIKRGFRLGNLQHAVTQKRREIISETKRKSMINNQWKSIKQTKLIKFKIFAFPSDSKIQLSWTSWLNHRKVHTDIPPITKTIAQAVMWGMWDVRSGSIVIYANWIKRKSFWLHDLLWGANSTNEVKSSRSGQTPSWTRN